MLNTKIHNIKILTRLEIKILRILAMHITWTEVAYRKTKIVTCKNGNIFGTYFPNLNGKVCML